MLGWQSSSLDGGLARGLQGLLDPGQLNEAAQPIQTRRRLVQRLREFGLKFHKKRDVMNTSLFYPTSPAKSLTDWHYA